MVAQSVKNFLLVVLLSFIGMQSYATPFIANPPDQLGPFNGGNLTETIVSPGFSTAGGATLTFDLLGYLSVDGSNCCTDTFTLTVNGSPLFQGGFNMGGDGTNFVNFQDPGVTIVSTTNFGIFQGGLTQFSVAHTLLQGANTYDFDYGAMQGLGDEGWGLSNVFVTANVTIPGGGGNVPEPGTLALLGLGIAGLGFSRRKEVQT